MRAILNYTMRLDMVGRTRLRSINLPGDIGPEPARENRVRRAEAGRWQKHD